MRELFVTAWVVLAASLGAACTEKSPPAGAPSQTEAQAQSERSSAKESSGAVATAGEAPKEKVAGTVPDGAPCTSREECANPSSTCLLLPGELLRTCTTVMRVDDPPVAVVPPSAAGPFKLGMPRARLETLDVKRSAPKTVAGSKGGAFTQIDSGPFGLVFNAKDELQWIDVTPARSPGGLLIGGSRVSRDVTRDGLVKVLAGCGEPRTRGDDTVVRCRGAQVMTVGPEALLVLRLGAAE